MIREGIQKLIEKTNHNEKLSGRQMKNDQRRHTETD
jgi:hypothetical protein